jgi:hypothetical protein
MPLYNSVRPSRGSVNITSGVGEMPLHDCRVPSLGGVALHLVRRKCHYQVTGDRVYGGINITPDLQEMPLA